MLFALIVVTAVAVGCAILANLLAFRATPEERTAAMPADALIPEPALVMTQAVTIADSPWGVWPWLAQMGTGRGGWYSYDWIDNGGVESAQSIIRKFQHPQPGHVFPALPGARDVFIVEAVQKPRHLVLTAPDVEHGTRVTWEFLVRPLDDSRTRLVIRGRVSRHWLAPYVIVIGGLGHRVMQNRQIRGLRKRAERARRLAGMA